MGPWLGVKARPWPEPLAWGSCQVLAWGQPWHGPLTKAPDQGLRPGLEARPQSKALARDSGLRLWPGALAWGSGLGLWPGAPAWGSSLGPGHGVMPGAQAWGLNLGQGPGLGPWPRALAWALT